jgi:hypothetical protein
MTTNIARFDLSQGRAKPLFALMGWGQGHRASRDANNMAAHGQSTSEFHRLDPSLVPGQSRDGFHGQSTSEFHRLDPSLVPGQSRGPTSMGPRNCSIFHEPWWLSAATGGRYDEVTVKHLGRVLGRLPFIGVRRGPFRISVLPPFTHLLGPVIDTVVGKYQTQLAKRFSVGRELIGQLPKFDYFKQAFDPSLAGGLTIIDGLAFQDCGFQVSPHYTFEIDCRNSLESIWDGMHTEVRRHIRHAEKKHSVATISDPEHFIHYYCENIQKTNKANRINFAQFPGLFTETKARECGQITAALGRDGTPAAMIFLVWGHGVMYYLSSTRSPDVHGSDAISLLIWSAIKRAHKIGLKFDFDGVYSSGMARFLTGFGGQIKTRLIARGAGPLYRTLRFFKRSIIKDANQYFT